MAEERVKREIVINQNYKGFNPVSFGTQACPPEHSFGPAVRTHWLLHYVAEGEGIFVRDGITYQVKPGWIFVIPPYHETYYAASKTNPWRYIWIGFTADEEMPTPFNEAVINCPGAGAVFEDMLLCGRLKSGRSAFLCSKIWALMGILLEGGRVRENHIEKALNYMSTEYTRGISVQEVAEKLNLSRSYFSALFKAHMQISPQRYLTNLRMERAAELLARHGESPSMAAFSCGYSDIYHFSKMFKQHFGLSPRNYQKKFQGDCQG